MKVHLPTSDVRDGGDDDAVDVLGPGKPVQKPQRQGKTMSTLSIATFYEPTMTI